MKEFITNMILSGPVVIIPFLIFLCAVIFLIYLGVTFIIDTHDYRRDISGDSLKDSATMKTLKEFKTFNNEGVNTNAKTRIHVTRRT